MRKTLSLIVLVLLSAAAFAQTAPLRPKRAIENALIDAVALMDEGNVDAARAKLVLLEKADSTNDAVQYYLGSCALAANDIEAAERYFTRAVQLDSLNDYYYDALASVYMHSRKRQQATDLYEKLIERNPGKYRTPTVLTLLGDAALRVMRDSLAMARYNEALLYDPQYTPALLGKAEASRLKRNYPAFFVTMDQFIKDPDVLPQPKCDYVREVLQRADAQMARGWFPQLDSMVAGCLKTHPGDSSALKLAGWWYYGTGRRDQGKDYFAQWRERYPEDLSSHITYLEILISEGKPEQAIAECDRVIALAKEQGSDNELVTGYLIKADSYHTLGDTKKAFANYELALKLDPDNLPVLNNYAYYLSLGKKKLRKAAAMSRRTVELEPDNATYLDTYGWILYLLKKPEEAKPYFKHAMLYGGKESKVILEHYAEVLRALGEDSLADYYKGLSEKKKQ